MIEVYELTGGTSKSAWTRKGMMGDFPQFRHPSILRRTIPCGNDGTWTIKSFDTLTPESDIRKIENDFQITAGEIHHVPDVQTFGFIVEERRPPRKLDIERANAAGVKEGKKFALLKHGFPVMKDDGTGEVQPDEVTFRNPFKGRKLALLGDAYGVPPPMARLCRGADVLVHEATLFEKDESVSFFVLTYVVSF